MSIRKIYSDQQIADLYDRWKKSGLDLKTFCATYTPTPLPYDTIYKRFKRYQKRLEKPPSELKIPEQTIEKETTKRIIDLAREKFKVREIIADYILTYKQDFLKIIDDLIDVKLVHLGELATMFAHHIATKKGINPRTLTLEEIIEILKENAEEFFKKHDQIYKEILSLKYWKYILTHEKIPTSLEELANI